MSSGLLFFTQNEEDRMNSDENVEQASNETEMESTANFVLSHLDKDEMKELITKVAQEKLTAAKVGGFT